MPRADAPGTGRRTASDDSVNPRRTGPFRSSSGRRGPHAGLVKVALLAESFLPHMNGVTHSLLQVLRHLERRGHEALVVAPRSGPIDRVALRRADRAAPVGAAPELSRRARHARERAPARRGHARARRRGRAPRLAVRARLARARRRRDARHPLRRGVPDRHPLVCRAIRRAGRGARAHAAPRPAAPPRHAHPRAVELRRSSGSARPGSTTSGCGSGAAVSTPSGSHPLGAANGGVAASAEPDEVIVGYVGRLAPEKQVEDLRALADLPRTRLVVIGDGSVACRARAAAPRRPLHRIPRRRRARRGDGEPRRVRAPG